MPRVSAISSCNGLTLVSYEQDPCYACTYRFAVINPLSKQRHDLPPISIKIDPADLNIDDTAYDAVGIGFDKPTNTFKTVFLIVKDPDMDVLCAMVHASGTSLWRDSRNPSLSEKQRKKVYLVMGVWFGCVLGDDALSSPKDRIKIVWFDVNTEEFGLTEPLNIPYMISEAAINAELVGLNGEVGCVYTYPICINLWILKHEE
ncbi:hypothetical protein R6Q57_027339 [Mikania cordata]